MLTFWHENSLSASQPFFSLALMSTISSPPECPLYSPSSTTPAASPSGHTGARMVIPPLFLERQWLPFSGSAAEQSKRPLLFCLSQACPTLQWSSAGLQLMDQWSKLLAEQCSSHETQSSIYRATLICDLRASSAASFSLSCWISFRGTSVFRSFAVLSLISWSVWFLLHWYLDRAFLSVAVDLRLWAYSCICTFWRWSLTLSTSSACVDSDWMSTGCEWVCVQWNDFAFCSFKIQLQT